jgi:hypothetical protein
LQFSLQAASPKTFGHTLVHLLVQFTVKRWRAFGSITEGKLQEAMRSFCITVQQRVQRNGTYLKDLIFKKKKNVIDIGTRNVFQIK